MTPTTKQEPAGDPGSDHDDRDESEGVENQDPRALERLETTHVDLDGETHQLPAAIDANEVTPDGPIDTYTAVFYLEKGGVGKTTSATHLAVDAVSRGLRTVVVPLAGKQSDLAAHFGIEYPSEDPNVQPNIATAFKPERETFAELLGEKYAIPPKEAFVHELVHKTEEGVDVIPSHQQLDQIDDYLKDIGDHRERYSQLDTFVEEYLAPQYDVVLFDLPGAPSELSYTVLWAAQNVIVPASPGKFEQEQIMSIKDDLDTLRNLGRNIDLTTIIPTRIKTTPRLDREFVRDLLDDHGPYVAPAFIPESTAIGTAQKEGRTIFTDEEPSDTAAKARAAYRHIMGDILGRIELFREETADDGGSP